MNAQLSACVLAVLATASYGYTIDPEGLRQLESPQQRHLPMVADEASDQDPGEVPANHRLPGQWLNQQSPSHIPRPAHRRKLRKHKKLVSQRKWLSHNQRSPTKAEKVNKPLPMKSIEIEDSQFAKKHPIKTYHHEDPILDYYDPYPKYRFEYGVHDSVTGDFKSHHEERDGDVVRGSYELIEPSGAKRIVQYTADKDRGFIAVVHREEILHLDHNEQPAHNTQKVHRYQEPTPKSDEYQQAKVLRQFEQPARLVKSEHSSPGAELAGNAKDQGGEHDDLKQQSVQEEPLFYVISEPNSHSNLEPHETHDTHEYIGELLPDYDTYESYAQLPNNKNNIMIDNQYQAAGQETLEHNKYTESMSDPGLVFQSEIKGPLKPQHQIRLPEKDYSSQYENDWKANNLESFRRKKTRRSDGNEKVDEDQREVPQVLVKDMNKFKTTFNNALVEEGEEYQEELVNNRKKKKTNMTGNYQQPSTLDEQQVDRDLPFDLRRFQENLVRQYLSYQQQNLKENIRKHRVQQKKHTFGPKQIENYANVKSSVDANKSLNTRMENKKARLRSLKRQHKETFPSQEDHSNQEID